MNTAKPLAADELKRAQDAARALGAPRLCELTGISLRTLGRAVAGLPVMLCVRTALLRAAADLGAEAPRSAA